MSKTESKIGKTGNDKMEREREREREREHGIVTGWIVEIVEEAIKVLRYVLFQFRNVMDGFKILNTFYK